MERALHADRERIASHSIRRWENLQWLFTCWIWREKMRGGRRENKSGLGHRSSVQLVRQLREVSLLPRRRMRESRDNEITSVFLFLFFIFYLLLFFFWSGNITKVGMQICAWTLTYTDTHCDTAHTRARVKTVFQ